MTRGKFKTKVSRKVGLTIGDSGDEQSFLEDTFAEAIVEVLLETHCYVELGDMTLTSGQAEYRTDSSILAIEDMRETSSGQGYIYPEVVTMGEILRYQTLSQSGSPVQKIAHEGNLLIAWPTPSAADVIRFLYVPRPTAPVDDTSDSSVSTYGGIPSEYDRAIEYYGLWQASEYDEKRLAEGPRDYYTQFVQECARAKQRLRKKQGRRLRPAVIGYPGTRMRGAGQSRNDVY